ncbi:MAG: formate dehydrogenase accessory protein FdhE [bacterium]
MLTLEEYKNEKEYYLNFFKGIDAEKNNFKQIFDYHFPIVKIQIKYFQKFNPDVNIDKKEAENLLNQSNFLFSKYDFSIDKKLLNEFFTELLQFININCKIIDKINNDINSLSNPTLNKLKNSYIFSTLSENISKEEKEKFFLWYGILVPFYSKISFQIKNQIDLSIWKENICPICGESPSIARLDKENGKRFLWCNLCQIEWAFSRVCCVNCKNTNTDTLKYFYVEEDRTHRVDVCEECKTYIKTCDEQLADKKMYLMIENIITFFLDIISLKNGYKVLEKNENKM